MNTSTTYRDWPRAAVAFEMHWGQQCMVSVGTIGREHHLPATPAIRSQENGESTNARASPVNECVLFVRLRSRVSLTVRRIVCTPSLPNDSSDNDAVFLGSLVPSFALLRGAVALSSNTSDPVASRYGPARHGRDLLVGFLSARGWLNVLLALHGWWSFSYTCNGGQRCGRCSLVFDCGWRTP